MPVETVLDASVAAKCLFTEDGSEAASAYVAATPHTIAPDLIFAEVANVAAKSLRRANTDLAYGLKALSALPILLEEVVPTPELVAPALRLAAEFNLSAYDAVYVALADARGASLLTADRKLARRLDGTRLAPRLIVL